MGSQADESDQPSRAECVCSRTGAQGVGILGLGGFFEHPTSNIEHPTSNEEGKAKSNMKNVVLVIAIVFSCVLSCDASDVKKPEERSDYDKRKDVGLVAPQGAEKLFDGTKESIVKNWVMWPDAEMPV